MKLRYTIVLGLLWCQWITADVSHIAHEHEDRHYLPPHPGKPKISDEDREYLSPPHKHEHHAHDHADKKLVDHEYLPPKKDHGYHYDHPKHKEAHVDHTYLPPKPHHDHHDHHHQHEHEYEHHKKQLKEYNGSHGEHEQHNGHYTISKPKGLIADEPPNHPRPIATDFLLNPPQGDLFTPANDETTTYAGEASDPLVVAAAPNSVFHTQINVQSQESQFNVPNTQPRRNGGSNNGLQPTAGAGNSGLDGGFGLSDDTRLTNNINRRLSGRQGPNGNGLARTIGTRTPQRGNQVRLRDSTAGRTASRNDQRGLDAGILRNLDLTRGLTESELLNAIAGRTDGRNDNTRLDAGILRNLDRSRGLLASALRSNGLPTDISIDDLLRIIANGANGRDLERIINNEALLTEALRSAQQRITDENLLRLINNSGSRVVNGAAGVAGGRNAGAPGAPGANTLGEFQRLDAALNNANNARRINDLTTERRNSRNRARNQANANVLLRDGLDDRRSNFQAANIINGSIQSDELSRLAALARGRAQGNAQGINLIGTNVVSRSRPRGETILADALAQQQQDLDALDFVPNASSPKLIYADNGSLSAAGSEHNEKKTSLHGNGYHYDKPSKHFSN